MPKINITTEEKELLKKYFKTSPFLLLRLKSSAILMRDKGLLMKDIADIVSRDRKTVGEWLQSWEAKRMASIFTGHKGNENASKLTKIQKEQIKKALKKSTK